MATTLSPEDAAQLRTYERDRHNALAEGYIGFFSPVTALAIAPLLEAVRLAPGMKLLDVPTGSGALAAEATRRGASVVGIDISSEMVAQARKRHPGLDFRVGDVEHLPIADGVLDAVVCAFGIGHFPYPEASVAECMRTLKPGGRIAFSWWDTSDKQRIQGLIRDAVAEVGAKPPPVVPKGHSSLRFSDAGEFRRLLEGAGLADITLQDHRATHLVADVGRAVAWRARRTCAHLILDRPPGCADAGGDPGGAGEAGRCLQDAQRLGAADRLQSWSGAETGLSVPPRSLRSVARPVPDP